MNRRGMRRPNPQQERVPVLHLVSCHQGCGERSSQLPPFLKEGLDGHMIRSQWERTPHASQRHHRSITPPKSKGSSRHSFLGASSVAQPSGTSSSSCVGSTSFFGEGVTNTTPTPPPAASSP